MPRDNARDPAPARNPPKPGGEKIDPDDGPPEDDPRGPRRGKAPRKANAERPEQGGAGGANADCTIVGVGSSARGLDSFQRFLRALPNDTGMAFVLVPSPDSTRQDTAADAFGQDTSMAVVEPAESRPIAPNHVFVAPPGKFVRLEEGSLHPEEPDQEQSARLPIDHFFRSLAQQRAGRAVGVILSGTGPDGIQGLVEVKASGGMTIAERADLPGDALAHWTIDFSGTIKEIVEFLTRYARHPYALGKPEMLRLEEAAPSQFRSILALLQTHTNHDFGHYKKGTLNRRLERRMGIRHIESLGDYLKLLRDDPQEVRALSRDFLIGVTRFFREKEGWESLRKLTLAPLVEGKAAGEKVRVWVPGCSTGEEAYSLAMLFHEELERQRKDLVLQLFATDLDEEAVKVARRGIYPATISADVDPSRLGRFFVEEGEKFRVSKLLREKCVFAVQDLISDPPFSDLDLISCRNVMIYLESAIQQKIGELFHFALKPDGFLVLGPAESISPEGAVLFTRLSKEWRIYRKLPRRGGYRPSFPVVASPGRRLRLPSFEDPNEDAALGTVEHAHKVLLDRFAPPSVIVDESLHVRYFHGALRNYLELPHGKPTRELLAMAAEGLTTKLRTLLRQAAREGRAVTAIAPRVKRDDRRVPVRVTVEPMEGLRGGRQFLVSFLDEQPARSEPAPPKAGAQDAGSRRRKGQDAAVISQLESELHATREDLQSTVGELDTSTTELKASNQETMSVNERLRSSNEELEASREELQSLNEELSTVNSQLEEKVRELEATNDDLSNLLASTKIATLFLDTGLRIRRITPPCTELLRIVPGDVGRPISDVPLRIDDPDLLVDAREVLQRLLPIEREITAQEGRTFIRRLLPYRTAGDRIEGIVATFTDISPVKAAVRRVEVRERQQATVARLGHEALYSEDLEALFHLTVQTLAETLGVEFAKVLRLNPEQEFLTLVAGVGWKSGLVGNAAVSSGTDSQAGYTLHSQNPVVVKDLRSEKRFQGPSLLFEHEVVSGMSVVIGRDESPWGVLGVHTRSLRQFTVDDVHFLQSVAHLLQAAIHRRSIEDIRRDRETRLALVTDAVPALISYCDRNLVYRLCNARYEEWFGLRQEEMVGKSLPEVLGSRAFKRIEPYANRALNGEHVTFESELPYRHGPVRKVKADYLPHFGEDGGVVGFYAMVSDITELRRSEEARNRLAAIVESSHDAVIGKDLDGTILSWNAAASRIYGYDAEEVMGQPIELLIPEERREEMKFILDRIRHGESIEQLETVRLRKGREPVKVLVTVSPIRGGDGELIGASSISHDLTGRLAAERALRESEERLRLAQSAAGIGIYDWNPATGELRWDARVRQLWGIDEHQAVTYEKFMEGVHPDDRGATQLAVDRALDPAGDGNYQAEYRVVHRTDGRARWIAASGKATFESGAPVRLIGTVQDITERRNTELELEEWAERLEERVAERTAVAEKRAMDLRALATQITDAEERTRRQVAELLHDDLQQTLVAATMRLPAAGELASAEELRSVSELLGQALSRSRSLISELCPPILHQAGLGEALQWLAQHMQETHGLTVHLSCGDGIGCPHEVSRTILFNAVRELLFNVSKHAGVDSAQLEARSVDGAIEVRVTDEGKGFEVGSAFRNHDGFGLFSVRERIESYGGLFEVDSAPGKGARFRLRLPLEIRRAIHPPLRRSSARKPAVDRTMPNPDGLVRILIADDHRIVRDGLVQILDCRAEFQIVGEASDGQEAIDQALELRPDVVVMDISMPKLNGVEATQQIVEQLPGTIVVGLSLHDADGLGKAICEAGAATFLQKEVAGVRLIRTIHELCQQHGILPAPANESPGGPIE